MYDTKSGMILIDGHDIQEYPLVVLRENIAYVPQDNFLFPSKKELEEASIEHEFSRRENIVDQAYGDLEQVQEAAKKACIHDNIMEFTKQYATMVGERGVTVSGGQKQRSSIARALMKDAPILILDEENTIQPPENPVDLCSIQGRIEFDHVWFS